MLLRCESLDPPMSQLGQNRKSSMGAYVFRFAPESGHCPMQWALRVCAKLRHCS